MIFAIQCSCGTPYEVEMDAPATEPILCPTCGLDATEFANQQFAPSENVAADDAIYCHQHSDQPAEVYCLVCEKPMCGYCMQTSGFICSPLCKLRAQQQGLEIPECDRQDSVVTRRRGQGRKLLALGINTLVAGLVIALLGGWIWYTFWGAKPAVAFSTPVSADYDVELCRFLAPQRVIFASNDEIAVFDTANKKQLWSRTFPDVSQVEIGQTLLWVLADGALFALHPESGEEQAPTPSKGRVLSISLAGDTLFVITNNNQLVVVDATSGRVVAEYPAPAGTLHAESERFRFPTTSPSEDGDDPAVESAGIAAAAMINAAAAAAESVSEIDWDTEGGSDLQSFRREYTQDVKFEAKLIKENIVQREAMKPPEATALKEEGITVGDTLAMAQHIMNEQRRDVTGGIEHVDESTYRVQLHHLADQAAVPWTGDVIGRPQFFSLKSVDLLVAGQTLLTFDKQGKKLWESKLSYPITRNIPPAVETSGGLYFFDKGVLTAFDTATGTVRWRLGSVGVSKLQFDDAGMLYVSTTSASPETIRYSQQIDFGNPTQPLVMKVDPASGKILWQIEKIGDRCYVSGKFVYLTSSRGGMSETYFRIYRIDPKNGKQLWEYYRPEEPISMDFLDNQILALFPNRLEVLRFFSP